MLLYIQVKKHPTLSQQHSGFESAVSHVLAWSQKYMRKRSVSMGAICCQTANIPFVYMQDECSFVSLRDVERAMLVFAYFFEKMEFLRDVIKSKQPEGVMKRIVGPPATTYQSVSFYMSLLMFI